jgi:hypothetical protein
MVGVISNIDTADGAVVVSVNRVKRVECVRNAAVHAIGVDDPLCPKGGWAVFGSNARGEATKRILDRSQRRSCSAHGARRARTHHQRRCCWCCTIVHCIVHRVHRPGRLAKSVRRRAERHVRVARPRATHWRKHKSISRQPERVPRRGLDKDHSRTRVHGLRRQAAVHCPFCVCVYSLFRLSLWPCVSSCVGPPRPPSSHAYMSLQVARPIVGLCALRGPFFRKRSFFQRRSLGPSQKAPTRGPSKRDGERAR